VLAVVSIPEEQPPRPETPSKVIPMESEEYVIDAPIGDVMEVPEAAELSEVGEGQGES
jgi:hypothetical protein